MPRITLAPPLLPRVLLLLSLSACAGGPSTDSSADAGDEAPGETDPNDPQCGFIGASCSTDEGCCGALVCGSGGVCAGAPACEEDDALAGSADAPVALSNIAADAELVACDGFEELDVFTVEAAAGEILRLRLDTVGIAPDSDVGSQADIDLYVLSGPPTGVGSDGSGSIVEGPVLVAGATASSTERALLVTEEAGTYYVAVTLYGGPEASYTLTLTRGQSCKADADCGGVEDFCRVGVDVEYGQAVQECSTWTSPGCGAGADDEAGGDVHSSANAVPLEATASGKSCSGDIDVFAVEKALPQQVLLEVTSANVSETDALIAIIADPSGTLVDLFLVDTADEPAAYTIPVGAAAGTWHIYLEHFGSGTDVEVDYAVAAEVQDACRTDADCAAPQTCGTEVYGGGPQLVCVTAGDPCVDNDADNSRTSATALAADTPVSAGVCMGGFDIFAIELPEVTNNVILELAWAGAADLDVYVYAEDGTYLGAGWYGQGLERWRGYGLPAQTLYAWVDAFSCLSSTGEGTLCATQFDYSLEATLSTGLVCSDDDDCFVGGTNDGDSTRELSCQDLAVDTGSVKACVRPSSAQLFSGAGGDACFEGSDCASIFCLDEYCTATCAVDADCDSVLGGGEGYCFDLLETPLCAKKCAVAADCEASYGPVDGADWLCEAGKCQL
ncbi:MAG: hypothetical protein ACO3JL_00455 [Myxococcota bacterium]